MNNYRKYTSQIRFVALVFGILAVLSIGAKAQTNPDSSATLYGLHSFAAGQTARVSVVNRPPVFDGEIIPRIRVRVVFDFYEANSSASGIWRFARRIEREATLDRGEAASFDFTVSRAGGERISTSVFVRPEGTETDQINAASTLEVREGGRTLLSLPGVRKGFDPQPDPPVQD